MGIYHVATEMNRRAFCRAAATAALAPAGVVAASEPFRLRYILASAMYGTMKLAEILPEVAKAGAAHIDIWPRIHGDQREQIEAMGHDAAAAILRQNGVKLGAIACYKLGAFGLREEMRFARKLGGPGVVLVCTGKLPPKQRKNPTRSEQKQAIREFVETMKPHVEAAEKSGCVIAIENHVNSLLETPDSMRWFAERTAHAGPVGIAFAPHHLPQDAPLLAHLIEDLGPAVRFFYAQQYGMGARKKLPKEQELLQMPGRGSLDFTPIVAALKKINYTGFSEIFMHPVPRGVPILPTAAEITAEINHSRGYLEDCLRKTGP